MTVLYISARPQTIAADAEFDSFRAAARLEDSAVERHDLVTDPLVIGPSVTAVIVGGSPYNVTDPEATKTDEQRRGEDHLSRLAVACADGVGPAVLFTCYGIGVAARALGGEVTRAFPEDTGTAVVELTDAGQRDPVFGALASRFNVLTTHKEGCVAPPPGGVLLATNAACPVQAYRVGERLYATQFHPEPTAKAFAERMDVYRNDGYFPASDYDALAAQVVRTSITEPLRIIREFIGLFG
ncbi:GMP synthase [Microbacterium mangrovi]|uniref:GMP synthase n=1 Tax=Microbacterium mangrovi TaxID=1348253 RepID=A0A0B2A912_9MICO|nr:GMP synthase [Microbacterium mangrovi]KHK99590.1 GMP synthase [Microbacterium mangrovi]